MSMASKPHPIHDNILKYNKKKNKSINKNNNKNNSVTKSTSPAPSPYPITHQRINTPKKMNYNPSDYISSPKNNLNMLPGNHMDDRRYCSIENDKFGEVSGCSVTHQNIFKKSSQDFIKKISDDSFASQIFIKPKPKKEDMKMIDGIQLEKSSLSFHKFQNVPDFDTSHLENDYCDRSYRAHFNELTQ